jgi:restriction system protein
MARRKKQSPAEDVMDLVAMLPWWAGVALALVSFLFLHGLATPPSAAGVQGSQMATFAGRAAIAGLASIGQLVVPLLCLFAALGSFFKRRKREDLVNQVTQSSGADALNGMSWREFELLVGEAFRIQGYNVTEQGGPQPDGGVDLVLRKGSETFLVQCKQWKAYKVGVDVVRELYGVMAARGAAGGFVVTSGSFTPDAKAFADGRNVMLVEGPKLFGLIQQAKASLNGGAAAAPAAKARAPAPATTPAAATPVCPICASAMVRRTAKKGANAGSQFWGCSNYPACRGTR